MIEQARARRLAIAQIGTIDEGGGAAAVASGLMRGFASRGHRVWHLVGRKRTNDPNVMVLPDDDRPAFRFSGYTAVQTALHRLAGRHPDRGFGLIARSIRAAAHPQAITARLRGLEDFDFPATARLLDRLPVKPDIVHGHNLHGGYFDLRALASISARVPTVLTLHDMWMLTGHCAHSLDCSRWQTGCGMCPYLRLEPAVRRDATAENWRRKAAIYARSRLFVATPSAWLGDKLLSSMLAPAIAGARVIPNGVDTAVFRPANRAQVRRSLGLPPDTFIALVTTGSRGSMWKDDPTIRETIHRLAERPFTFQVLFIAVGRESAVARTGGAPTRSIPYQRDPAMMARYYQAADLYLHAARADTFPLAVLEALACGTPVVATAVGGIAEQITTVTPAAVRRGAVGAATGVLVAPGDSAEMAEGVEAVLAHDDARGQLAANGVADVGARFTLDRQVEAYLDWYREIIAL